MQQTGESADIGDVIKDDSARGPTKAEGNCGTGTYRCFCASTLIDTPDGARPVEALQVGDLVSTLDSGPQPVVWTWNGHQPLHGVECGQRPVLIRAGAIGPEMPFRDLILSPQHGVLVGEIGQFAAQSPSPALADAQMLTAEAGVRTMMGRHGIHWYNFAFQRHAIVRANGVYVESLLIGATTLASMTAWERRTISKAFPHPSGAYLNGPSARPGLPGQGQVAA